MSVKYRISNKTSIPKILSYIFLAWCLRRILSVVVIVVVVFVVVVFVQTHLFGDEISHQMIETENHVEGNL